MTRVSLRVNGSAVVTDVEPRTHLADLLRERLLLTGTRLGCEHGVCGACTLMLDGAPARSCITLAVACEAADVRTVEGFADDPLMEALRTAFSAQHALQCGYCTAGMLVTAYDIVCRLPAADDARIREELAGNLCRCTGYVGIVAAIGAVLARRREVGVEVPPPVAPPDATPRAPAKRSHLHVDAAVSRSARGVGELGAGPALRRQVDFGIPAARLWERVRDPEEMIGCVPGAKLLDQASDGSFRIQVSVAIGPMRAAFVGTARVIYDESARSGRLIGSSHDALTGTHADGEITFVVDGSGDDASILAFTMTYALKGTLAQFSRGALVESMVDRLLLGFARNIETRIGGARDAEPETAGRVGAGLRALWGRIVAWFAGGERS